MGLPGPHCASLVVASVVMLLSSAIASSPPSPTSFITCTAKGLHRAHNARIPEGGGKGGADGLPTLWCVRVPPLPLRIANTASWTVCGQDIPLSALVQAGSRGRDGSRPPPIMRGVRHPERAIGFWAQARGRSTSCSIWPTIERTFLETPPGISIIAPVACTTPASRSSNVSTTPSKTYILIQKGGRSSTELAARVSRGTAQAGSPGGAAQP